MIPCFVINLDRVPDRMTEMRQQFDAANVLDRMQRFPAIDAKSSGFTAPGYAPHTWRDRWELKLSEQAVFESHRAVWNKIAYSQPFGGVVCEDDILLSNRFGAALAALDLHRFGVIKLDGFPTARRFGPVIEMNGWSVRHILQAPPSAACYAVSRAAARTLLQDSQSYCETLDDFLFRRRGTLRPVQIEPAVAVQGMFCEGQSQSTKAIVFESEREQGDIGLAQAAKGPVLYRLLKEVRRSGRKLTNAGVVMRGGGRHQPMLADDLPQYKK